jgi:dTDP-glucose 4,6-dehydratase
MPGNKIMMPALKNPLTRDLDYILAQTAELWPALRQQRIFITGGTGFFGCWLLESFAWANRRLNLQAEAVVLTRNPEAFCQKVPHLASDPTIRLCPGDVREFSFPAGPFSYVIHAATPASARLIAEAPLEMFETIVQGTRRVLEFARTQPLQAMLFTSSGAVYGKQPPELSHIPETYRGGPDPLNPDSAYAEGKRAAEQFGALYARTYGVPLKIARCFAFVGPYLPLDEHFAIGNFIRDGLRGGPIVVKGDGTPYRSYLYAADLAIWLWTLLFKGQTNTAYNVGSSEAVSIRELAGRVANFFTPTLPVNIQGIAFPNQLPERYVPDISKMRKDFGIETKIGLDESIRRTIEWYQNQ